MSKEPELLQSPFDGGEASAIAQAFALADGIAGVFVPPARRVGLAIGKIAGRIREVFVRPYYLLDTGELLTRFIEARIAYVEERYDQGLPIEGAYLDDIVRTVKVTLDSVISRTYSKYFGRAKSQPRGPDANSEEAFRSYCYFILVKRLSQPRTDREKAHGMSGLAQKTEQFAAAFAVCRALDLLRSGANHEQAFADLNGPDEYERDMAEYVVADGSNVLNARKTEPPDLVFERMEKQRQLSRSLFRLPRRQRQILQLRFVQGLAPQEISERIGVPVQRVYQLIRTAKRHLGRVLSETDESD